MFRLFASFVVSAVSLLPQAPVSAGSARHQLVSGVDVGALDRSVNPCEDFYQFACGNWLAKNPIPADRAAWGRLSEIQERNLKLLREILEKARAAARRSPIEQKIGDYYASCMDEAGIEAKGAAPLQPVLKRIGQIRTLADLAREITRLHRMQVYVPFTIESGQDFNDASRVILHVDQGGLGLPERDYYLKEDPKSQETRQKYVAHVTRMFELLGDAPQRAATAAKTVMTLETELARASLPIVERRDPQRLNHVMPVGNLVALSPSFPWKRYLAEVGSPPVESLNVSVPGFVEHLEKLLQSVPIEDWKTYLRWHYVRSAAPFLPKAFVEENFNFYGRTLTGARELQPRWKRCVQFTDGDLGEALGQKYVEVAFAGASKQRMLELVKNLEKALEEDIRQLEWMTEQTKQRALEKLHAISNKVGYPDRWRDYSPLKIVRGDALGNAQRANEFEHRRRLSKVGKPVDKSEWYMTPPTVNAYYDPQNNDINFPAGILQPPMFDLRRDDALNYGAIGAVIGHELTHGFDDQGRKFDAKGNLSDWWTPQDAEEFNRRASCFVDQYSQYVAVDDVKLNGKLTLGENVADNGGVRIAFLAYMAQLTAEDRARLVDGFTPQQRVFLGWAQGWCTNTRDELARLRALTDPHSPPKYRVNGVVSNMPEFQKAFGCHVGQPMVRERACRVW